MPEHRYLFVLTTHSGSDAAVREELESRLADVLEFEPVGGATWSLSLYCVTRDAFLGGSGSLSGDGS